VIKSNINIDTGDNCANHTNIEGNIILETIFFFVKHCKNYTWTWEVILPLTAILKMEKMENVDGVVENPEEGQGDGAGEVRRGNWGKMTNGVRWRMITTDKPLQI
jgi:hypothetical protein